MTSIPPPPNGFTPSVEGIPAALQYNEREKALRDTFVSEYLVDYNGLKAAMRCGFPREFATEWAQKLLDEPYVQQMLQSVSMTPMDPKKEAEYNQQRIKNQLLREAFYHGPGSSHAARVAAGVALAKLYGMEPPKKTEATVKHAGGVMIAPGVADLSSWEGAASESQDALTRDASS